jgi:hypothetical protein
MMRCGVGMRGDYLESNRPPQGAMNLDKTSYVPDKTRFVQRRVPLSAICGIIPPTNNVLISLRYLYYYHLPSPINFSKVKIILD